MAPVNPIIYGLPTTSSSDYSFASDTHAIFTGIYRFAASTKIRAVGDGITIEVTETGGIVGQSDTPLLVRGTGSTITNAGTIGSTTPAMPAIDIVSGGDGVTTVVNSGFIKGIKAASSGTELLRIENTGTLNGENGQLFDGYNWNGTIHFVHSGFATSYQDSTNDLSLGKGNDIYDGSGGGTVTGSILGWTGNDWFILGQTRENIRGGNGIDTIDYRSQGPMTVDLAAGMAFSTTPDDILHSVENVIGSLQDDVLIGDTAANALLGATGTDRISGDGGNDVLNGGLGADVLEGGLGYDSFVFADPEDGGDQITDFTLGVVGNVDFMRFRGADFGGIALGILDNELFCGRRGNAAREADDRFIYDLDDNTLWYDPDGTGEAEAVMMADLQDGAVLSAYAIAIF